MSDAVSGNSGVEEEFLWTCTLTGADKVYDWSPEVATLVQLLTGSLFILFFREDRYQFEPPGPDRVQG